LPVGLLDALGIKSGAYPNQLAEVLQPFVPILDLLASSACSEIVSTTVNANSVGQSVGFTIPQGEVWLCSGFSVQATTLVGEAITLSLIQRSIAAGSGGNAIRRWAADGSSAVGVRFSVSASDGLFWAQGGTYIGFAVHNITTAGNIVVTVSGNILRCRR
jgi:hypothetical protein